MTANKTSQTGSKQKSQVSCFHFSFLDTHQQQLIFSFSAFRVRRFSSLTRPSRGPSPELQHEVSRTLTLTLAAAARGKANRPPNMIITASTWMATENDLIPCLLPAQRRMMMMVRVPVCHRRLVILTLARSDSFRYRCISISERET